MAMANLSLYGPFTWVQPRGQNGLLPGGEHDWFGADFSGNPVVWEVTAHPIRAVGVAELAVINLRTFQASSGPPGINFTVRNVGSVGVSFYNVYISGVGF
jgi:hypothetical protein